MTIAVRVNFELAESSHTPYDFDEVKMEYNESNRRYSGKIALHKK